MTGTEYEDWCAEYLKKLGFHHIRKTKATGDQGIDLIAQRRGLTCGFQCKYYSSSIGNEAVQQAYAGMTYYGLDRAAVITNTEFTPAARALAASTGVELYENAVPEHNNHGDLLIRLSAFLMFGLCIYRYTQLIQDPSGASQYGLLANTFILAASLSALLAAGRYGALAFSAVCTFLCLASSLFDPHVFLPHTVSAGFFLILLLIRMIVLKKGILKKQYQEESIQLREWIDESMQQLSEEIAGLLSGQLGTEITVRETEKLSDGSFRFVCHSPKNIQEDLAVSIYTLNQYAQSEKEDLFFELNAEDQRNFTVLMKRKKRKSDNELV